MFFSLLTELLTETNQVVASNSRSDVDQCVKKWVLSYVVCAILILITMFAVYLIFRNELWTRYNVSTLFCFLDIVGIWKLKINGKSFSLFLRIRELTKNICWNYYLCKSANQLASENPVLGIRSQIKIPFREMPWRSWGVWAAVVLLWMSRELPKCEWNVSGSDVSL